MSKREPLLMALALTAFSAAALMPSIRGVDGVGNYVYLMSILNDGDLNFSNEYAAFDLAEPDRGYRHADAPVHPETARPANRFGIGAALFWAPAVMIVHSVLSLVAPELATGISRPYAAAVGMASAWWGCLGLWLLWGRMRSQWSALASWGAAAGILFATPLMFYLWMHGSMSHAVSFFIAVMALLTLEQAWKERSAGQSLLLGVWAGLLAMTRFQDATWTVAFGVGLIAFWNRANRADAERERRDEDTATSYAPAVGGRIPLWAAAALFALGAALALAPQMTVWKILYGSFLSGPLPYFGGGAGQFHPAPVHFFRVLFSERGGFLAWHPILAIGLTGMLRSVLRRDAPEPRIESKSAVPDSRLLKFPVGPERWLFAVGLLGLGFQVYLVSCWSVWWAGASFGNRFFISSYPWLALGLAALLERLHERRWRRLASVAILALIAWNFGLLIQYGTEMIPREDPAPWSVVIRNQFTEVPAWLLERIF